MASKTRERVETWVVVTVIAVLIWLYAEGANVQQLSRQPVQISFKVPPGQEDEFAVLPIEPTQANVSFEGASSQVQRFQRLANKPFEVVIEPGAEDFIERVVVLQDALNQAGLGELGVTVTEVDPPTQSVTVKRLVTVPLRVQVETGNYRFSSNPPPTPTPAEVDVTVPADLARSLRGGYVAARLDEVVPGELTPNTEQVQRDVPLEFPASVRLDDRYHSVSHRTVQVNYTTEDLDETFVIKRVPIFVNLPVGVQRQYAIRPTDEQNFLTDVEVRGPSDTIAKIRQGDPSFTVRAEIRESDPNRIEFMTAVQPVIIAPPGVTAVEATKLIAVEVVKR
jgi:hypothetical protein